MANRLMIPGDVYLGENALEMAEAAISSLGTKALMVTGHSMIKQGYVDYLIKLLEKNSIQTVVFSEITGEPTDEMIEKGIVAYKENNCDFIIGFGGGSPLDSAKAIGAMITNKGNIADYNGKVIPNKIPPFLAIPTTAGTGSEVTQFTIITDTKKQIKMLLKGPLLLPDVVVVDPKFTMQTPKSVTAATGLDALTHAVEAYTSKKAFSTTDIFALSAVKRIFKYLPVAYKDGTNKKAREEMSLAAFEAGICINNSTVTIVHGMSRPIGALFHVPHGISNAMLIAKCLSFAKDGAYERFANLARTIGVSSDEDDDKTAASKFIDAISNICSICEVPTLEEYGINKDMFFEKINKMAKDAFDSGSPSNTRKDISIEDIKEIYKSLW